MPAASNTGPGLIAQLEGRLGLVGKSWLTPDVAALHWRPVEIPLVNLVIAGAVALLMLMMGYSVPRVGVFAALGLAVYIQMHNSSARPHERGHAAAEANGRRGINSLQSPPPQRR